MKRTTIFTLGAATLALAIAAPNAQARPAGRPSGPPPPLAHVIERHSDELGLDAATLDSIQALQRQDREASQELHQSIQAGRGQLRALLDSDEPSEAAVIAQVEALGELETQARVARVRTDLAVRRLLTSEQFAALLSLRPAPPKDGERGTQGRHERPQREGRLERGGFAPSR